MLLCDFGLSAIKEDYSNPMYHTSSTPKYNLPWTAPEIVLSESLPRPNKTTDIYSFGSVTFQVLTQLLAHTRLLLISSPLGISWGSTIPRYGKWTSLYIIARWEVPSSSTWRFDLRGFLAVYGTVLGSNPGKKARSG